MAVMVVTVNSESLSHKGWLIIAAGSQPSLAGGSPKWVSLFGGGALKRNVQRGSFLLPEVVCSVCGLGD